MSYVDNYIKPRGHHNYIAFFLTLNCNLKCPYCINLHNSGSRHNSIARKIMTADEWIKAANRFILRRDIPLTIQGGEPTLHRGFYKFVNEVKEEIKLDLLTNLMFDVDKFINNVPPWRFNREAPYAPIRVSYHPGQNNIDELIKKTFELQDAGFQIGLYGILHPDESIKKHIIETQKKCLNLGIDFRTKEFLGEWNGKLYGTFLFDDSISREEMQFCECRTTEILVGPDGYVYRCHSDLYKKRNPISHILDENFTDSEIERFRDCYYFGDCNPCDVKVKTNRFQIFGHTSVEIKNFRNNMVKSNG